MSTPDPPGSRPPSDHDGPAKEHSPAEDRRQLLAALERARRERDEALLSLLEAEQRLAVRDSDSRPAP